MMSLEECCNGLQEEGWDSQAKETVSQRPTETGLLVNIPQRILIGAGYHNKILRRPSSILNRPGTSANVVLWPRITFYQLKDSSSHSRPSQVYLLLLDSCLYPPWALVRLFTAVSFSALVPVHIGTTEARQFPAPSWSFANIQQVSRCDQDISLDN